MGVTESLLAEINRQLDTRKLIKIKVLKNKNQNFQKILETILNKTGAKLVYSIGFTFVLYREKR